MIIFTKILASILISPALLWAIQNDISFWIVFPLCFLNGYFVASGVNNAMS